METIALAGMKPWCYLHKTACPHMVIAASFKFRRCRCLKADTGDHHQILSTLPANRADPHSDPAVMFNSSEAPVCGRLPPPAYALGDAHIWGCGARHFRHPGGALWRISP